ncbi:MAG: CRISPR-associated endonuclease Cas1 [Xenococcus sp. MO_188.B8]|nr:CRISPR-associated endonuclease Cas1 [Xenococcus sp. MO_188.B8]
MPTLYIVEQGAALRVKHQQFHVLQQQQLLFKIPVTQVENIILFGLTA